MSISYMSNAKWRRALSALAKSNRGDSCVWKLVHTDESQAGRVPDPDEIRDDYVDESAVPCPTEYLQIEWLEIQAEYRWQPYDNAPTSSRRQDLLAARRALEAAGQFQLSESPEGLRLYGYRP